MTGVIYAVPYSAWPSLAPPCSAFYSLRGPFWVVGDRTVLTTRQRSDFRYPRCQCALEVAEAGFEPATCRSFRLPGFCQLNYSVIGRLVLTDCSGKAMIFYLYSAGPCLPASAFSASLSDKAKDRMHSNAAQYCINSFPQRHEAYAATPAATPIRWHTADLFILDVVWFYSL